MTDGDGRGIPLADPGTGHDPVAVGHFQRLLHRPEAAFDDHAPGLPPLGRFIEHVGAGVDPFHDAAVSAVERPQASLVRQENAVTHSQARFTRVDREHFAPRPAAVVADGAAGFFGVGVLAAPVVAERSVQPVLVPSQRDAVQKAIAVLRELVRLDDVKLDARQDRNLGTLRNRAAVPDLDRFRDLDLVRRRRFVRQRANRRRRQHPAEQRHFVDRPQKRLHQPAAVVHGSDRQRRLGDRDGRCQPGFALLFSVDVQSPLSTLDRHCDVNPMPRLRLGLGADGLPTPIPEIEPEAVVGIDHQSPFALIGRVDVLGHDHLLATVQRVDVDPGGNAEVGIGKRDRVGGRDGDIITQAIQLQSLPCDAGDQFRSPGDFSCQLARNVRNNPRLDRLKRPNRKRRIGRHRRWLRPDRRRRKQDRNDGDRGL